jgi:hypothetical protein
MATELVAIEDGQHARLKAIQQMENAGEFPRLRIKARVTIRSRSENICHE